MAKEKLFTPEDFDKPKPKNKKLFKTILIVLGIIVFIGLCIWWIIPITQSDNDKTVTDVSSEQVNQEGLNPNETIEQTDSISDVNNVEEIDKSNDQVVERGETSTQSEPISTNSISDNVEAEAIKVIRGEYGNVPERKQLLGEQFQVIQARVNQMKRQGLL